MRASRGNYCNRNVYLTKLMKSLISSIKLLDNYVRKHLYKFLACRATKGMENISE